MMYPRGIVARSGVIREMSRGCGGYGVALAAVFLFHTLVCWSPAQGQTKNTPVRNVPAGKSLPSTGAPLSRGIALYEAGRYEDALNELRTVVDSGASKGRALAFYYAARIRMQMGNLPAARKNLLAARADSAKFHDAVGLLAYVNLKMGNRTDALIEWRQFVRAVGSSDSARVTVDSIMLPEDHHRRLERAAALKSAPSIQAGKTSAPQATPVSTPLSTPPTASLSTSPNAASSPAPPDTSALSPAESTKNTTRPAIGRPDSAGITLTNIDQRIESQIRRGYYGVGAAAALLLAGLAGIAWWMRRRHRAAPQLTFSATVDRALDEVDVEEGLAPDEESLEREFERRRMEIKEESPKSKTQSPKPEERPKPEDRPAAGTYSPRYGDREPEARIPMSSLRDEQSIFPSFESDDRDARFRPPASARSGSGAESGRRPITEEVKALVARMSREGHSTVEIARIADLTRTEVELIVAVRARGMEQLIETASQEEDDIPDQGALYRAIGEMHAEGRPPIEIARRLGISATEVNLALAMMEKKRGRRR